LRRAYDISVFGKEPYPNYNRILLSLVVPADLVVMAVGIRPNTALAESAGLHCNRGIVDDTLQAVTDPRIYAVGECVNPLGVAYGWSPAVRTGQGRRQSPGGIQHRPLPRLHDLHQGLTMIAW